MPISDRNTATVSEPSSCFFYWSIQSAATSLFFSSSFPPFHSPFWDFPSGPPSYLFHPPPSLSDLCNPMHFFGLVRSSSAANLFPPPPCDECLSPPFIPLLVISSAPSLVCCNRRHRRRRPKSSHSSVPNMKSRQSHASVYDGVCVLLLPVRVYVSGGYPFRGICVFLW